MRVASRCAANGPCSSPAANTLLLDAQSGRIGAGTIEAGAWSASTAASRVVQSTALHGGSQGGTLFSPVLPAAALLLGSADNQAPGRVVMQRGLAALALVGLSMACSAPAMAQTLDAATDARIKALEARVAELEKREAVAPLTADDTVVASPARAADASAPAAPSARMAAAAPTAVAAPPPRVAAPAPPTDWSALRRGMSQRQVTDLFGKPGNKRTLPLTATWYYPDESGHIVQFDRDGRVESWSAP